MACFQRSSPALKEILLKLYRSERAMDIDHYLHEFGSVEYRIQSSVSDPQCTYVSISTPVLSQGVLLPDGLSLYTVEMVKQICSDVVGIIEPAKEGYQLTLRLDFTKIPNGKESTIITEISTLQAVILSSQLKEMLRNINSQIVANVMYKPIKLVYHPREPFFVIKQPKKIITVFPMRFKEKTDVIIATSFFQELMDVGSSEKWTKAPPCNWSPIPPPELRGEPFEDLSTNGGFVTFDISSRYVEGRKLDKTVWSLLNFYAYVKYHVKTTRGFIRRRMRKHTEGLVEVLQKENSEDEKQSGEVQGFGCMRRLTSEPRTLKRRCHNLSMKIKRIRFRMKVHGFGRFRRRWLALPKFSSSMGYSKLD